MGLFSRVRRVNGAELPAESAVSAAPALDLDPAAEPAPPASFSSPPRPPAPSVGSLRDGLQQLYSIRPSREAFAEETVKLIAKSAGVKAAALLGYEPRASRLRLLAHAGLEADAVQTLSGDNMVSGWDIPLRSARNRRINVIESAHDNPFVPRSLVAISPRRLTIAALPFFHANAPVGVVVLFSPTARGFADGLLKALSQSLRVCALALSELPAAGGVAARPVEQLTGGAQPSLLRGLAALKAELARLTEALEEAERQRAAEAAERVTAQSFLKAAQERAARLGEELADLRTASERVPEIEQQLHSLSRRLADASEAADAARSEATRLQAAVADREQRSGRDAAAIAELTAVRAQLDEQLQSALAAARQHGEDAAVLQTQLAELRPRAAQVADLRTALAATEAAKAETEALAERVRVELRAAQEQGTRAETALAEASTALAASQADRTAVGLQLTAAQARLTELTHAHDELTALGAGGRELAATAERAAARINALEADHIRLAAERDQLQAQAEQATADLAQRGVALQTLEHDLDTGRRALAEADAERLRLTDRLAALAREVEAAHAAGAALEARLAEQTDADNRLAAERRDLLARIDMLAAGGQSLECERQAAVNAAHQRSGELEAEIGRLSAALEAARSQATTEITRTRDDATATLDGLRVDLAAAVRGRDELQRALGAAQQESAAHQGALAEMAAEREARALAEQAFAATEARYQTEIAALRDRQAADTQEQARLAQELAEKQMLLQSAEENLTAAIDLSVESDDRDAVLDIDRDYAADGVTTAEIEPPGAEADDPAGGNYVLLEDDEIGGATARRLIEFGHRVSRLAPTPEASEALKERSVACAAVNLATPNAWALLRHIRNGSGIPRMPLIAYALAANAPKGFWLGAVDFTFLPVAQVDLVAILNRLVHKVKRVIAMSNDIDVMSDVRTQLTGAGISTAVVLDGRQALDLVPTIRPEAAVLHLSPSCVDVFRAIAGLRSVETSRDIPIVFLLDAEAQPREEAFLSAGLRMLTGRGSLEADGLVDSLAAAFDGYPPV